MAVERYHCNEMESEVMSVEMDGEWVSYEDYNKLASLTDGLNYPCVCSSGHKLPVEYWGLECPWCRLIEACKEAVDTGEWADHTDRDKFIEVIKELDPTYEPFKRFCSKLFDGMRFNDAE